MILVAYFLPLDCVRIRILFVGDCGAGDEGGWGECGTAIGSLEGSFICIDRDSRTDALTGGLLMSVCTGGIFVLGLAGAVG